MSIACKYNGIHHLTEIISTTGPVHGLQELLHQLPTTGPSHGSLHWTCRLLRQPSFTDCTLKRYWMLLLPRQRTSTNGELVLELLLLRRRLKARGALCGKVGESEKLSFSRKKKVAGHCFLLVPQQRGGGRGAETVPVSGPMFSPFRHSWRISWLAAESAGRY